MGIELYAKVKKGHQYESQNHMHQREYGYPYFKVEGIDFPYILGGLGGNYPIASCQFFLKTGEKMFVHIGNAPKNIKEIFHD